MKDKETDQARTLALAPRPEDMPVRVDVAMTRRAAEYTGPPTPADPAGDAWRRKAAWVARRPYLA